MASFRFIYVASPRRAYIEPIFLGLLVMISLVKQNLIALVYLGGDQSQRPADLLQILLFPLTNRLAPDIRLHELVSLQETTIVDIANKSELFARILHREHVVVAFLLSVLLSRIRVGKVGGWSVMEENRVHDIKEV